MSQRKLKDLIDSYNIELLKNANHTFGDKVHTFGDKVHTYGGSALRKILLNISKATVEVRREISNNHKKDNKIKEDLTTEEVMDERSLPIILNGKTPRLAKLII
jgi:hypothetical protein